MLEFSVFDYPLGRPVCARSDSTISSAAGWSTGETTVLIEGGGLARIVDRCRESGLVECCACGECWREMFTLSAASSLNENSRETEPTKSEDDESSDRPALEVLFDAADAHAVAAGEPDHVVGDLQEILRAAWRIMTPRQRAVLFKRPELVNLAELPEYEHLACRYVRRE